MAEAKGPKQKRPYLATECHDVVEADKWRQQILREIGRKVMEIQNAGLGDHRCLHRPSPCMSAMMGKKEGSGRSLPSPGCHGNATLRYLACMHKTGHILVVHLLI